jgi:branched-chain amino acid transport system permease protein
MSQTTGERGLNIFNKHKKDFRVVLIFFVLLQAVMGIMSLSQSSQYYTRIFYLAEINILLTVSLSLINGYTGQFSIGHAGFMAIGAYASVMITTIIPRLLTGHPVLVSSVSGHALFLLSLLFAGLAAGFFGFIIGFPSLRLKGDYLAIVTLAAGEVIRALLRFFDFAGGPRGVPGIPKFSNAIYLGIVFIGSLWIMRNFVYSHYGRACIAVRDDEIAARSLGINTTFQKVLAFVVGAGFAGIAGGLFAHMSQYINPDNFGILKSLDILIFLYVGGSHTFAGGIVGAGLFTFVPEILRFANLENWRMVLYPLILIVVMRFKMEGIMGRREFGFLIPWKSKIFSKQENK